MSTPQIRIDRDACRGARVCVRLAPTVFALDGGGKAVVRDAGAVAPETLREAARACPWFAIELAEDHAS